jgi:CoA-transferase family III
MALTGDPAGPPLAPATSAAAAVDAALAPFGLDAGVLVERAASAGLTRGGRVACGRGSRLLRAANGWLALTLSRPDDVASLPALLEAGFEGEPDGTGDGAPWEHVARLVAARPAEEVAARAELLGMPCGMVGEPMAAPSLPGAEAAAARRPPPYVVDLSALWAGPLATSCLLRAGATVVKVEDVRRPDGTRRGDPAFHDLLNGGKLSVALDLGMADGRRALASLVDRADVVVTSARARAVEALGLDPEAALAATTDKVWVAITAHGWGSSRVGFGDDVAAAAGLVAWHPEDGEPRFAADAIADPLAGALAAHAAVAAWQQGGRHFVDASLAAAARSVAPKAAEPARAAEARWSIDGQPVTSPRPRAADRPAAEPARAAEARWSIDGQPVTSPRPRAADRPAAGLGADTDAVLAAASA